MFRGDATSRFLSLKQEARLDGPFMMCHEFVTAQNYTDSIGSSTKKVLCATDFGQGACDH